MNNCAEGCGREAEIGVWCKTCYHRNYYRETRRPKAVAVLGDCCQRCGSKDNLEFDHIDRVLKSFDISDNLTPSNAAVEAELQKCQLLCTDCHRKKTAEENEGFTHGTMYGWMKKKCSCADCEAAKRAHNDARNAARRKTGPTARGSYRPRKGATL